MSRIVAMRVAALVPCAVIPLLSGAVVAQETPLYVNCEYRFAVIFPQAPMARDVTFTTSSGAAVPARQFYLERGGERYSVTVVRTMGAPVDEQVIEHAAQTIRQRGEVRFQFEAPYDPGMPGRQLNIVEPNGRQHRASVYMADNHLTITEANAAPGSFPALQFEQSILLVDADGADRERNAGQEPRKFDCRTGLPLGEASGLHQP